MSVFISYRRDGGMPIAEDIYTSLSEEYDVFLDVESLKNGFFDTAIVEKIKQCSDFIVLITETVFNRCSEPNDWIFHEAMIALHENKNIIPIFVGLTSFPPNVPEALRDICRFNGIFWSNAKQSCPKIKSFLISNKRYIISVVRNQDKIGLSTETKNDLVNLYQRFLKNGRLPVDVRIEIQDPKDLSTLMLRDDIIDSYGVDSALHIAEQSLLKKIKWIHDELECAISYMLQDEMLDACAFKMRDHYVSMYGAKKCIYIDDDGIENYAITPYVWKEIVEELLKELVTDRYNDYGNSKDYIGIDCSVEKRNGSEIWMFSSFIPVLKDNEAVMALIETLKMPGGRADYLDIPLRILTLHTYPDLYYNVGLLKTNKTTQSFDEINKYKDVFNLLHYSFGLH